MMKTDIMGQIPNRMALAGGWIDQPFMSRHNPDPFGSMVVVALDPAIRFMDRCGFASSTRKVAERLWGGCLPEGNPAELVKALYTEENRGKREPSGSQDMIGILYPGINRLDYDFSYEGGVFPRHIESNNNPASVRWLEEVICIVPVNQRPPGYNPLKIKNITPEGVRSLGRTGRACFEAIVNRDVAGLGAALNSSMKCWDMLLPNTLDHPTLDLNLKEILTYYQERCHGAMYSGCGGGYLIIVSDKPVPGSFSVTVRTAPHPGISI
jgi:hypothetical protein